MKLNFNRKLLSVFLILMGATPLLKAFDNSHFFKVANLAGIKSHNTTDWKNTVNGRLGYGSARTGYDYEENKSSILDIHGYQNMLYLATDVPGAGSDPVTNAYINLAQQINHSNTNDDFGKLSFKGKFTLLEGNIDIRQNLVDGFFIEGRLPIRRVKIENISYEDVSPAATLYGANYAEWIQLKQQLNNVLNVYGIKDYDTMYDTTDLGDLSIIAGWQYENKDDIDFLKYYSLALRLGVLFPTGKKADTSYAFSVPTGYNGHWGIPARLDVNIGAQDWLSINLYTGAIFFFDKTYNMRMRTNKNQTGFIKLAEGKAKVDKGTHWDIGGNLLFDHFFKGASILAGYSFNMKSSESYTPSNSDCSSSCSTVSSSNAFCSSIVDGDPAAYTWKQEVIHLMAEYDFGVHLKKKNWNAKLNAYCDFLMGGKNVFASNMYTGGAELSFQF